MRSSSKRYAFDLTRPLHRYVWQMGGLLGKFSLILDSLGVVGLGLSGAGLLTMAFAENDRILALGLRAGIISLCAGIACFGLARVVDFVGKFRHGEDPRSLVLKQRQLRSTDVQAESLPAVTPEWMRVPSTEQAPMNRSTPNLRLVEPRTNGGDAPAARTGTADRP